ncbi:MAG TPA: NAD(P)H-hydrate dehydratase, partial [Crinalium sp.]
QLPDALVVCCPETETGAIAHLPDSIDLSKYHAIACGPGLTPKADQAVKQVLTCSCPLVLDADGLNVVADLGTRETLVQRQAPTVLTPHPGEFKRLFPDLADQMSDRIQAVQTAATQSGVVVLIKGARVAIANPQGNVWINPESTPALARGGSGDVLTGLLGGLLAQNAAASSTHAIEAIVQSAVWWHAQAGILAKEDRTELGVDAATLAHYLIPTLRQQLQRFSIA